MNRKEFVDLTKATFIRWQKQDATLRAGALTFFTIMPLPSLALIAIAIFAQIYGQQQALVQFINQVSTVAGPSVANLLSELLKNAQSPLTSLFASFLSVAFAVSGALGAFSVLRKSINAIWDIKPAQVKKAASVKSRVIPFILIISLGLIVVAWTAFSTVLFDAIVFVLNPILGGFAPLFLRLLQIILSLALGALLFAIIFKQLPDTDVKWQDVTLAAIITSFVFTILNYLFGVYLSVFHVTTLAGTAGALMVLFLWVYLTNLFILFGAQFSKIYAETHGSLSSKPKAKKEKYPEEPVEKVDVKAKFEITLSPA